MNNNDIEEDKVARAKERISKLLNNVLYSTLYSQEENEEDERILLAYIKQLETKLENTYWKGYVDKQNEAAEICKICKYKAKANKYNRLAERIESKLEYAENLLKETAKGSLQEYIPSELIFMIKIYEELMKEE